MNDTLPDHDYDGIREEDHPSPRWWTVMLWLTILFAVVYVPVVHIFDFLPQGELQRTMAQAARVQEQRDLELEASGELDKDPVTAGKKYFKTFCVSCHGAFGEGGIGPNLHDAFWIHGPTETDIRNVISTGVAAKGMPSWGPILGERKIKSLAAYVMTLWEEKLPEGIAGKKAEGEEYDMSIVRAPQESDEKAAADDSSAARS